MNEVQEPDLARQNELRKVEGEIENIAGLLSQVPGEHPHIPLLLAGLGSYHCSRFDLLGEPNDIDKAIELTVAALKTVPNDHVELSDLLSSLGSFHAKRFQRLGEVHDSDKAIECVSAALSLTPEGDPKLTHRLANLGVFYSGRFRRLGGLDDLEKAIRYESCALELTSDSDPELSLRLGNLGVSHSARFERLGDLSDLEKAIEYESRAVELAPPGHPSLAKQLPNLGVSHTRRYDRIGELYDLEKAIEYGSRALELTPDSDPYFPSQLANLGVAYSHRFQRLGDLNDLEKAIEYDNRALELTPNDLPDFPSRLSNLAASHSHKFARLGDLGDLEKAIECQHRAHTLTPDGHPDMSSRLGNLGVLHGYRFERLGEPNDLKQSAMYQLRALEVTAEGHPDLPLRLGNLAVSFRHLFDRSGEISFLNQSIEYETRALAVTPEGHQDVMDRLANLGASHGYRYGKLGELGDLEKAIEYASRAILLTPSGHSQLPGRLSNLGVSLKDRYRSLGEKDDLESAIECDSRALALTPSDHPDLPVRYFNYALSSLRYYQHTQNILHLQDSLHLFRKASQSEIGVPRAKFIHALTWANYASQYSSLNPIEAYQTAIDLLHRFSWLGATTRQRYSEIAAAGDFAVNAACTAIISSEFHLALEWLEHARCVVWTQNLMLRSPLDQLRSSHPALAARLETVSTQLHHAASRSRDPISLVLGPDSLIPEQVAQQHRRLAKEYDDLLSETRKLPGFESFLQPMRAGKLVRAAKIGPIVVINCHSDRCDALALLPGQDNIIHIPLLNYTQDKAQQARSDMERSLRRKGLRERGVKVRHDPEFRDDMQGVFSALWYDIVWPVLEALGYTNNDSTSSLPHITWCPTGALAFLPLHAAGDYDQPRCRVFDHVISSYTPTITALLSSTPVSRTCNSRVLAVGMGSTPDHSSLPGTAKELACVQTHLENIAGYTQLVNSEATISGVLNAMEQHDWVHLACHAHQNVEDSTESGFFLHDGTLDLASINRRSFRNKGLAFLSACQTATGDERLPDEAIHLASGMLMAGYSSVIGTMWSVVDEDAPFVADKVYSQLMEDGMIGNGEAGKALHYAVGALRERVGEKEFGRWVPYIHIGS